jgi:phage gp29-like protein
MASVLHSATVGRAGNTGYWGWSNTGEYLSKLDGAAGRTIYEKMRRSDHQVQAVLKAIVLPILSADYYVEPASDKPKDRKIAATLQDALLKGMSMTWDDTLRHALLMLPFGFSPLEKVYEYRDGLVLPRKLDPRLPTSVVQWTFDKAANRLTHMIQQDSDGARYSIPIEKLLVFTNEKEGDNWEGISLLRPAYKAWYIKEQLEKIDAIKHERWGVGIPEYQVPKTAERDSEEWSAAETTLQNIHANEQAYAMTPEGWKLNVIGAGPGSSPDTLASIRHYDEAIAKTMLAMHINLGSSTVGAKNLGESFLSAFLMANQAKADYIAEVIDRFCVRELVEMNWGVRDYPHFKCRRIASLSLQAIGYLVQAGVITRDLELENSMREVLRLPARKEEAPKPAPAPVPPKPPAPAEPQEPAEDEPAEEPEEDTE